MSQPSDTPSAKIVLCPSCGRKLRIPHELLGKAVKCPTCAQNFQGSEHPSAVGSGEHSGTVPTAQASPAFDPDLAGAATQDFPGPLPLQRQSDVSMSPSQEPEAPEEDYEEPSAFRGRRDAEPHRGGMILVLGIFSIVLCLCGPFGLPFGIAAWVMGHIDLRKMRENQMDPSGQDLTKAGMVLGIIGTILDILGLLLWLAYFGLIFAIVAGMRNAPQPTAPTPAPPAQPPLKKAEGEVLPRRLADYLPGTAC